jgi:hypothetical protein
LQRLTARRDTYKDNATNFKEAHRTTGKALEEINNDIIRKIALRKKIEWRFNFPDAAHMSGVWKKLIRSAKVTSKKVKFILKEQSLSEEILLTLSAEVEHSVNSRALMHVSMDSRDFN